MTEKIGGFVQGRYVEDLPATMRSTGEPPGPESDRRGPHRPVDLRHRIHGGLSAGARGRGRPPEGAGSEVPVEERLGAASASVTKAVDDVVGAVRTLVGTEEGHQYMEAKVNSAGETLSSVLRDLQARVGSSLKKK